MTAHRTDSSRRPIVLATGGTGGHVFPAEALAEELASRGWPLALVTDGRARRWGRALESHPIHTIAAASPSGSALSKLVGIGRLALGLLQAVRLMGRIRPAAVVGFGGYAAAPTVLAAQLCGFPTVLHEQNAVFGRSNRLVGARAKRIAVSFARVARIDDGDPRVANIGNPVREAVRVIGERPYEAPMADGPIRLLVTGGSQGAASFGEVVPAAVAALPPDLRRRFVVVQQCRQEDLAKAHAVYAPLGVRAELAPFFADLPAKLAEAHVLVARAGASTVAELTAAGRPAVLVPYPFAAEDHQRANAAALELGDAAILLPHERFTVEALANHLHALAGDPARLAAMAAAARALGKPDAARRLADLVVAVVAPQPAPTAAQGAAA